MTKPKLKAKIICKNCGTSFLPRSTHSPQRRFCCNACRDEYWRRIRSTNFIEINCMYCGKLFLPKRANQTCCSVKCQRTRLHDLKYFGGLRRTAIGYEERKCWICGKLDLRRMHIHHMIGRKNADLPLIVLCPGCHKLVTELGKRKFLYEEHKVADLITLARFEGTLPDARTVVIYEK